MKPWEQHAANKRAVNHPHAHTHTPDPAGDDTEHEAQTPRHVVSDAEAPSSARNISSRLQKRAAPKEDWNSAWGLGFISIPPNIAWASLSVAKYDFDTQETVYAFNRDESDGRYQTLYNIEQDFEPNNPVGVLPPLQAPGHDPTVTLTWRRSFSAAFTQPLTTP